MGETAACVRVVGIRSQFFHVRVGGEAWLCPVTVLVEHSSRGGHEGDACTEIDGS